MKSVKRNKSTPSVTKHDVEKYVIDILSEIKEKDIDERVVEHAKVMKISIGGKNLSKNIPFVPIHNVSFHYEESVVK